MVSNDGTIIKIQRGRHVVERLTSKEASSESIGTVPCLSRVIQNAALADIHLAKGVI